jgi:hypothetical protein
MGNRESVMRATFQANLQEKQTQAGEVSLLNQDQSLGNILDLQSN